METKIVSLKELQEDNPTLCLSPYRVFGRCHECDKFKAANYRREKKGFPEDEEETIKDLRCKPVIKPEILELLRKKRQLLDQIKEVEEEINKT